LVGIRWATAILHAIYAALGRVLYVAIMAVATVIGFIARWVGWGMEMIAAAIVFLARMIGRLSMVLWRTSIVPAAKWVWWKSRVGSSRLALALQRSARWSAARGKEAAIFSAARAKEGAIWSAQKIAVWSKLAWDRVVLPNAKRAVVLAGRVGEWIKLKAIKLAGQARVSAVAFGAWSAKQPGVLWKTALLPAGKYAFQRLAAAKSSLLEARKLRAEIGSLAAVATGETKEDTPRQPEPSPEPIVTSTPEEPVSPQPRAAESPAPVAEEPVQPKAKKKKKATQDSVEA